MKLRAFTSVVAAVFILGVVAANAVAYSDVDYFFTRISGGDSVSSSFNILDDGYTPATQQIYYATATFALLDLNFAGPSCAV